jgi:hypothetical protein
MRYLTCVLTLALVSGGTTVARAAQVTWSVAHNIVGHSDVSTTGISRGAYNFGGVGVPGATINSVTFVSFPFDGSATSFTVGDLTVGSPGADASETLTDASSLGSASEPFANLNSAYRALLDQGVTELNGDRVVPLTMNDLTVGSQYIIQLWVNRSSSTIGGSIIWDSLGSPRNEVTLKANSIGSSGGVGQFVIGSFIADMPTQSIYLVGSPPLLNAFQLRQMAVPEPTTALLAVAIPALLRRRRALE